MKHIVVAVDGSAQSEITAKWTMDNMIKEELCQIHLLHVVSSPLNDAIFFSGTTSTFYSAEYIEEIHKKVSI